MHSLEVSKNGDREHTRDGVWKAGSSRLQRNFAGRKSSAGSRKLIWTGAYVHLIIVTGHTDRRQFFGGHRVGAANALTS